jgi:hypothetical protein
MGGKFERPRGANARMRMRGCECEDANARMRPRNTILRRAGGENRSVRARGDTLNLYFYADSTGYPGTCRERKSPRRLTIATPWGAAEREFGGCGAGEILQHWRDFFFAPWKAAGSIPLSRYLI